MTTIVVDTAAVEKKVKLEELTNMYMKVSQCWQNPTLAVRYRMSVEKALALLNYVSFEAGKRRAGQRLSKLSRKLLDEIVNGQAEPATAEAEVGA